MRLRALTPVVAAGATLGLVALTPQAAQAQSDVLRDPYNDVLKVSGAAGPTGSTTNVASVDVNQVKINHSGGTKGQLVWTYTLKDLKPKDAYSAFGLFKTNTNQVYLVRFNVNRDDPGIFLLRKKGDDYVELTCSRSNLNATSAPTPNTVTLRLRRSCVGNPASVRFGAGIVGYPRAGGLLVEDANRGKMTAPPDNAFGFKLTTKSYAAG